MGLRVDRGNVVGLPGSAEDPSEVCGHKVTQDQTALLSVALQSYSNTLGQVQSWWRAGLKQSRRFSGQEAGRRDGG